MKTLNMFLAIVMAFSFSISQAQSKPGITTETLKVWGNCGMCQDRIEKAAKEAGATTATWSEETKMLSVSFDASNTSLASIEDKIAAVGHDTKNVSAANDTYKKLPGCCKYERKAAGKEGIAACCQATGEPKSCCGKDKACCSK